MTDITHAPLPLCEPFEIAMTKKEWDDFKEQWRKGNFKK